MKTNGLSPLPSEIKKTEFCRHCNLRGHNEKECRKYGENTRNGTSVPGKAFESWKTDRRYERGRRTDQYHPYWDGNRNAAVQQPEYTPDELASKIAKQREELLLREVALRNTAIGEAPLPSRATYSKSNASHRVRSPSVIEIRDTPDREEEELRARLAAETLRMEEELRLKEKEKELERRLQQEFEEKKRAMEEEIRKQVQLEERAKLQMELAQQRTFPPPMQQYPPLVPPQYPSSTMPPTNFSSYGDGGYDRENYANYDRETGGGDYARDPGTSSYSSVPDFELEEIKRLIKETEDKLLDLQRNAREAELSVIFQSRAFQTVSELGDSAYMLDRSQKQHLLRELKELLSHAGPKEKEIQSRERSRGHSRSAEKSRRRSSYRHHDRSPARRSSRSPRRRSSYRHSKKEDEYKEVRHQVGGITLRNLNPVERRHLKIGDIVVAQDSGTAKWTTAHIAKISGDTATLSIGNATWKKPIRDLFKEVNEWSL
ncbi:unnamed protein product [Cylicostephanus goldi]|uniref:Uncharacterized protein n=1 Tax=Cylicostephanus goldi TaxID=71465 RepID=A0A3P6RH12_CYLGO|nr:unnamed protein product [Cylicostephanus goldi]